MSNRLNTLRPLGYLLLTSWAGFATAQESALVDHYAAIALAGYEDSLIATEAMQSAINSLVEGPSSETLAAAREAWRQARVPYQQTEAYRFGNPIVDDWEGRVNAWPLDEGLIDYVDGSYGTESDANVLYSANVIANPSVTIAGQEIDASTITPELLSNTLHEAAGNEANVATGYHAIEFLLWGQDLNFTGPGAGDRPHTDFSTTDCTNGHCARRIEYLQASTDLLIADLTEMVANWQPDGAATRDLIAAGETQAISRMLTGLGSLSYGELAGERMRLGIMLHDPEEEHDCFADNTHYSHYYDAKGIQNVYLGTYERINGDVLEGSSLSEHVAALDPSLDTEMKARLDETMQSMQGIVDRASETEAYDQMIGEGNDEGNAVVQAAVDALVNQTRSIERIVLALGASDVAIEGSDSLDDPDSVFQ